MQFSMQSLLISFLIKGLVLCKIDGSSQFNATFRYHLHIGFWTHRLICLSYSINVLPNWNWDKICLKACFYIAARHKLKEKRIKKYIFFFCPINAVKRGETWLISCHGPKYASFLVWWVLLISAFSLWWKEEIFSSQLILTNQDKVVVQKVLKYYQ